MTISREIKFKAIVHYEHFEKSLRKVADKYGVSKSILARWVSREKSQSCKPVIRKPPTAAQVESFVGEFVSKQPFAHAKDIQIHLRETRNVCVSLSTLYRALKSGGYTLKNAQRCPVGLPPTNHPFMKMERPYDGAIAVDECHFWTTDGRKRGWSLKGCRTPKGPPARKASFTLILGIDRSGVVSHVIHRGSVNAETFKSFLDTLPRNKPVILDNE